MTQLISGDHIKIHQLNVFFSDVTFMLLEIFDLPRYENSVFILGDYVYHPIQYFRQLYPDSRIIIYQLEQMVGSDTWHSVAKTIEHIRGADEIWDYDYLNAEYLSWYQVKVDRVIPLLYTSSLERVKPVSPPSIDVLFYGYINERRFRILKGLQKALYNRISLMWLYGVHGEALDPYIANSKIILNLHAFEPWHRQEQVRIFYPVINSKLVISETSQVNYFDDCIVEADEHELADVLTYWLVKKRWLGKGIYGREHYKTISLAYLNNGV